jgi:alpha-L-arabinofuranosidase
MMNSNIDLHQITINLSVWGSMNIFNWPKTLEQARFLFLAAEWPANSTRRSSFLLMNSIPMFRTHLDLIEFANGSNQTKWGKIREQMGHPAPFQSQNDWGWK